MLSLSWPNESMLDLSQLTLRKGRLTYANGERTSDRIGGILYPRVRPGLEEHTRSPRLERDRMANLLCRGCGNNPTKRLGAVLWLVGPDARTWSSWPAGRAESSPPLCAACWERREFRERVVPGSSLWWVSGYALAGVRGALLAPSRTGGLEKRADVRVMSNDPRVPMVLAREAVRLLSGCTPATTDQVVEAQRQQLDSAERRASRTARRRSA